MSEKPVALITGATRGIGCAIAVELGRTHRVLVGGREAAAVANVVAELPDGGPFVADLTDAVSVAAACAGIGRLDVLIHSAGIGMSGEVAELTREQWHQVFDVNVVAVADLTRRLLPALRQASGMVVAINSGSGFRSGSGGGAYAASKFALRAFTDALREEERGRVRVTSVHPGRTDTDMQVQLQRVMGNDSYDASLYIRPESIARAVRLVVDQSPEATVEEISIRPVAN